MQKSKIYGKLVSFIPVRRGDWVFKASVYRDKYVMIVAINPATCEFHTRHFKNQNEAVNWLEMLVEKESRLHSPPGE
jgi:hypothetical protein